MPSDGDPTHEMGEDPRLPDFPERKAMERYHDILQEREFLTHEEFKVFLTEVGTDGGMKKRGTFGPGSGEVFVYAKPNFYFSNLDKARQALNICQQLTQASVLAPTTKWGIYQRPSGNFQIFAVTQKLELVPIPEGSDSLYKSRLLKARMPTELETVELDDGEIYRNPMGRLPGSDKLYPVDIEIIALNRLGIEDPDADKIERGFAGPNTQAIKI
jgi:hypothetical protein